MLFCQLLESPNPSQPYQSPSNKPMKKTILNQCLLPALAALALVASTSQTQAQFPQGNYVNNFAVGANTAPFSGSGSVASWIYWYNQPGGNTPMTNDVTTPDPLGGAGAGSLEVFSPFPPADGPHDQNVFFGTFGNGGGYDFSVTANLLNFDTISFDVYVNPTNQVTPPDGNGNWGTLNVGVINTGYGYEGFSAGAVTIPGSASNGWVHLSVPIDHTIANVTDIPGIAFGYNNYGGYPTNPFTFWLGNLVMHYTGKPPPPPTVSLEKITAKGLTQFADKLPNYNRQDIATSSTNGTANVTWYGQPNKVTYSWTISSFPPASYSNFLSGFSLTPDAVASQNYSDPDWSASNDLWIAMQNNADGTVTAGIAWKTNEPAGNTQLYGSGVLVPYGNETNGLTVPSAIGTWTVTFTSDTALTLTAPNGSSTNVSLPSDFAALYNGYVGAFLYSAPTANANIGQYCTYSAYKITGVGTPVNEDLTSGALSAPFLTLISQNYNYTGNYVTNPPNQVFATASDADWFTWTLPAAGYSPVASANLSPPVWNNLPGSPFLNGAGNWLEVTTSSLPSSGQGFFAMIQRQFTQLQVLLPGQTNAPGTTLGYVGTPTPQSVSTPTTVTVNACDASWNIISGVNDTIQLATPMDGASFLPTATAMVNGTVTFSGANGLLFQTQGSQTVTATDTTTATIPVATSAAVTVGP
jgi:hypothetical protein